MILRCRQNRALQNGELFGVDEYHHSGPFPLQLDVTQPWPQAKMPDQVRRGSLADDAYSLSTTPEDEARLTAPDESTSLLDAGTASSYAGSERQVQPADKDSWDGYEEFKGLPWYKRPSVRPLAGGPQPGGAILLTLIYSRSTGCSLRMLSSRWPSVAP